MGLRAVFQRALKGSPGCCPGMRPANHHGQVLLTQADAAPGSCQRYRPADLKHLQNSHNQGEPPVDISLIGVSLTNQLTKNHTARSSSRQVRVCSICNAARKALRRSPVGKTSGGDTVFGMEAGRVDGSTAFFIGLQVLFRLYVILEMLLSI